MYKVFEQSVDDPLDTESIYRSRHDKLWNQLGPAEAPLVRQALHRAHELRQAQADPGDAYLEGLVEQLVLPGISEAITEPEGDPIPQSETVVRSMGATAIPRQPSTS